MWAFVFFGSFIVYLITLAPTVTFWDSGDLVSASWCLGISHQPGYPVLDMIGRLFSFLPLGNIAYRANLQSAFFSSLALLVLYFILLEISETGAINRAPAFSKNGNIAAAIRPDAARPDAGRPVAALAALLPAFVKPMWSQAVVTKPLALNSFFISMLVYAWVLAVRGKLSPERYFALSGFLFGLGLVNHQSLILYAPALLFSWFIVPLPGVGEDGAVRREREAYLPRIKLALLSLFFTLLGLSVYLYLPIRAAAMPVMNLGHPDTWRRFAWTVKWGEYLRAGIPYENLPLIFKGINLKDPRLLLGVAAALFLAWRALRRDLKLFLPIVVFMLVYISGIAMQTTGGAGSRFGLAAKFYIPAFIMAVPFIYAEGPWRAGRAWKTATTAVFAAVVVILLLSDFHQEDASHRFFAFDYAQNSLKSIDINGVLFTWGDNGAFPLWYLHDVEKYRDDAVVIHTPLMTYGWYLSDVQRWLGRDIKFAEPYYLGENVYRILKTVEPSSGGRTVAYDYSTVKFLNLNTNTLHARGLVYFEGRIPPGNPWKFYVFRGVKDKKIYKDPMAKNIIQIYNYQKKFSNIF